MLTIGLIDNYAIMRMGLGIIIKDHFNVPQILEAEELEGFQNVYGSKEPDLMIMGLNSISKDECIARVTNVRKCFPATPLIIYDENIDLNLVVPYFKLGVKGYLLKQNSASEMINCIDSVLANHQFLCPVLLEKLLKTLARQSESAPKKTLLTRRESEIATYLSQGMKTSSIATRLGRKPSTISTIKNSIFKKMKVENIMELSRFFPV
jgi:DNA-binding NarL/FixJ family response regulator